MGSGKLLTGLVGLALVVAAWLALQGSRAGRGAGEAESGAPQPAPGPARLAAAAGGPDERREAGTPPPGPEDEERLPGTLALRLVARETGRPLAGVEVGLLESRFLSSPMGRTDADGRAELGAEPEVELTLLVDPLASGPARGGRFEVVPFRPGERRESELALESAPDLRWFARILDDESGAPLAGASASWLSGTETLAAASAADGMLELPLASWCTTLVRIESPGRLPVRIVAEAGHESPEAAVVVRLGVPAELAVRVRDPLGAPLAGLRVEVAPVEPDVPPVLLDEAARRGEGHTDADGLVHFGGLPTGRALRVFLRPAPGRSQSQDLVLAPRERRTLDFTLGGGCRVQGTVRDEDGHALAGLDLWRLATGERPAYLEPAHEGAVVEKARSDAHGRFAFASVPAGDWWIGPAPYHRRDGHVPLATRVTIAPEETVRELALVCRAAQYLRGLVLDARGRPAEASVRASQGGVQLETTSSAGDGRFVLGPLQGGAWFLEARALQEEARTLAELAGLGAGVLLAGEVRARGEPQGVQGAQVAVLGPVLVVPGRETGPLELRLVPAAELRVRLAPGAPAGLRVALLWHGEVLRSDPIRAGSERVESLPAGELVVELRNEELVLERVHAALRAGEGTTVELRGVP